MGLCLYIHKILKVQLRSFILNILFILFYLSLIWLIVSLLFKLWLVQNLNFLHVHVTGWKERGGAFSFSGSNHLARRKLFQVWTWEGGVGNELDWNHFARKPKISLHFFSFSKVKLLIKWFVRVSPPHA